ncbi:MAG: hypothetical protein OXN89_11965 [Bryobacterales bacterium]|nr:hypothetical protein [Bryobacterales bacterium]
MGRCKLSSAGYARMFQIRRQLNWLYNHALEQRRDAWKPEGKSVTL